MIRATLLVARFEYVRHVLQRRFLVATLGLPLLVALFVALALWVAAGLSGPELPWALVGAGNVPGVELRFADEESAEAAVVGGRIGGYVVLRDEGRALARAVRRVPPGIALHLHERAKHYVLSRVPAERRALLAAPVELRHVAANDIGAPLSSEAVRARAGGAVAVPLVFAMAVLFATSFLVQAVSEEKESRILEVLVSSTRPMALIGGKVLGLGALSLTQTCVWIAVAAAAAVALVGRAAWPQLSELPWAAVLASLPYFVGGYLVYAALMVGVGVVMGGAREAQQVAGFIGLFLVAPFALLIVLVARPASPAAVALSLFPLTAPVAMPMRLIMSAVPPATWVLGLGLLTATSGCLIWLAARLFGVTLLVVGERGSVRAIVGALRQ